MGMKTASRTGLPGCRLFHVHIPWVMLAPSSQKPLQSTLGFSEWAEK